MDSKQKLILLCISIFNVYDLVSDIIVYEEGEYDLELKPVFLMATICGGLSNVWFVVAAIFRMNAFEYEERKKSAHFMQGAEYMRMMLEDVPMTIC